MRQRRLPGRVQYAAVSPWIPAGDYAIWRDASNQPAATVTVASGQVTTTHWPA
ncbi:MAG TPA: hypothetical protein VHJ18_02895 [Streptosporangiaceae bacterium]|nr:hypothetical protein [Streptosporangiaceae bacterium]